MKTRVAQPGSPDRAGFARAGVEAPPAALLLMLFRVKARAARLRPGNGAFKVNHSHIACLPQVIWLGPRRCSSIGACLLKIGFWFRLLLFRFPRFPERRRPRPRPLLLSEFLVSDLPTVCDFGQEHSGSFYLFFGPQMDRHLSTREHLRRWDLPGLYVTTQSPCLQLKLFGSFSSGKHYVSNVTYRFEDVKI